MENILQISSLLSQHMLLLLPLSLFSSILISFSLIFIFKKLNILDIPNTRSNHKKPIPVGGGIAIVITTLWTLFLTFLSQTTENQIKYLSFSIIIIAFISFIDDLKNLKVRTRIPFHIISIILLLKSLLFPQHNIYMFITLIVGIFFFINFYNFMDGIDGSAASEAIHIGMSIILLCVFDRSIPQELLIVALVLVGASLGFAIFNWHPAKIFLGDVGSLSLGVICAWLLLNLALYKYLAASIIIPLYYMADSALTLTKRLLQGKKIWQAHSEHFFQKAVRKGLSHAKVTRKIILTNFILCILSIFSVYYPIIALTASIAVVGMLLYHFQKV
jgi:UDP-N-acetylmuramyl pentapeptide phosphotransferase/UDP-N-acetylglucosamine-1-phosphate transferase